MSTAAYPAKREAVIPVVEGLLEGLAPFVHRCEPAGSYRREVCIPAITSYEPPDTLIPMPENANGVWVYFDDLIRQGRAVALKPGTMDLDLKWKAKRKLEPPAKLYRILLTAPKLVVEIWMTTPEQWGCIFLIRTGPAEFSRHVVTRARYRGKRFKDGRLFHDFSGQFITTPEEYDVFAALGMPYQEPPDRKVIR